MQCAISGTQTTDPVVSPRSGGIFERKLASAYVATSGKDPLNDEPLTVEELVTVSSGGLPVISPPKPVEFHSIPTMLAAFQNEWDALALEVFTLRKQLSSTREELSMALYKYDAAVRVAAKATRDKEEAQRALEQISETFATRQSENLSEKDQSMEVTQAAEPLASPESIPIAETSDDFVTVISQARESLFALHKQSKLSLSVTPQSAVSVTINETDIDIVHPLALTLNPKNGHAIVSGESEIICLPSNKKFAAFQAVAFLHNESSTEPIGIMSEGLMNLLTDEKHTFSLGKVRTLLTHPSIPYFVALTEEEKWVFANQDRVIYTSEAYSTIFAAAIHVDGALLGLATKEKVEIIDLTSFAAVSTVEIAGMNEITDIQFGLNGYWLFICGKLDSETGQVRVYDLRKGSLVHTFGCSADVELVIDPSCQVLTICDKIKKSISVHLYAKKGKKWMENVHTEDCGALHSVQLKSSAEDLQSSKIVKVCGLKGDKLADLEISLS